jgi:UPF0716 protein FxsA
MKKFAIGAALVLAGELVLLVVLGARLGAAVPAIWTLAAGAMGALLVRRCGGRALAALQPGAPAGASFGAAVAVVAGILLVVPGILTDLAALLLLVPPLRAAMGRALAARAARFLGGAGGPFPGPFPGLFVARGGGGGAGRRGPVIDVEPADEAPRPVRGVGRSVTRR